jgi:hypothetical protein
MGLDWSKILDLEKAHMEAGPPQMRLKRTGDISNGEERKTRKLNKEN